jgi:hypothetical protein
MAFLAYTKIVPPPEPPPDEIPQYLRTRRQIGLFVMGATFFTLSSMITRRAILKKRALIKPAYYHFSNAPPKQPVNGGLEALEALQIATINVGSIAMMWTGGLLWAFDIASLEEMRKRLRESWGDESGAEEEWEDWLASIVEKRKEKERRRKEDGGSVVGKGGGEE